MEPLHMSPAASTHVSTTGSELLATRKELFSPITRREQLAVLTSESIPPILNLGIPPLPTKSTSAQPNRKAVISPTFSPLLPAMKTILSSVMRQARRESIHTSSEGFRNQLGRSSPCQDGLFGPETPLHKVFGRLSVLDVMSAQETEQFVERLQEVRDELGRVAMRRYFRMLQPAHQTRKVLIAEIDVNDKGFMEGGYWNDGGHTLATEDDGLWNNVASALQEEAAVEQARKLRSSYRGFRIGPGAKSVATPVENLSPSTPPSVPTAVGIVSAQINPSYPYPKPGTAYGPLEQAVDTTLFASQPLMARQDVRSDLPFRVLRGTDGHHAQTRKRGRGDGPDGRTERLFSDEENFGYQNLQEITTYSRYNTGAFGRGWVDSSIGRNWWRERDTYAVNLQVHGVYHPYIAESYGLDKPFTDSTATDWHNWKENSWRGEQNPGNYSAVIDGDHRPQFGPAWGSRNRQHYARTASSTAQHVHSPLPGPGERRNASNAMQTHGQVIEPEATNHVDEASATRWNSELTDLAAEMAGQAAAGVGYAEPATSNQAADLSRPQIDRNTQTPTPNASDVSKGLKKSAKKKAKKSEAAKTALSLTAKHGAKETVEPGSEDNIGSQEESTKGG